MRILWSYLAMLLIVYETSSQLTRQQSFSQSGNVVPYILYFDAYVSQTVTLTYSTRCPNLQIMVANQVGIIISNYSTVGYNNGNSYTFSFGISMGMKQSISLIDWSGATSCNWSFSFMLNFNCMIVNSKCYDCSSYTTCTYCVTGYFLYLNFCYPNIPNCVTRFQLACMQCAYGYLLDNGNCIACQSYMPNCANCISDTQCTNCPTGYALMTGNAGCARCDSWIANCTTCTNSTKCTGCPNGYALADALTCQFCNLTLSNCTSCYTTTSCSSCTTGFALDSNHNCQPCSSFISDCLLCYNSAYCYKCSPGYSLSATACTQCTFTMAGCKTCNATDCLDCYDGYWYNSTLKQCFDCTDQMPNCNGSCRSATYCDSCSAGYGLMNTVAGTRNCSLCSSAISQCLTCYDLYYCSTCVDGYFIYHYYYPYYSSNGKDCRPCTWFLDYCTTCSSPNACQACINTGYALSPDNRCYSCSRWMENCLNCSDYSTCTRCGSGTILLNGRCKPCFVLIPNCAICSSATVCIRCQTGYQIDPATGDCQPCSFFLSNCTLCSSITVCTQCLPGTILNNSKCITCGELFPNCVGCINNVSCAICNKGYIPSPNLCTACSGFINHCANCFDSQHCQQCYDPYTTDLEKKCKCKQPLYNVSDFCVADPNCVSAYKKNGTVYCSFCNKAALYELDANHQCICKKGYTKVNHQCVVVCGDGLIINQQCDDNNTIDGDGCSSHCTIQPDFTCSTLSSGMSFCRFIQNIDLKYEYTFKMLHQNKGRMYFSLVSINPAVRRFYFSQRFKFAIMHNRSGSLNVTSWEMNEQGQIVVDIEYNETIQDSNINLKFNFDSSFLISEPCYLKFPMKGTNFPLVISELNQNYQFIYNMAKYIVLIEYGLALLLLFSDKFIAVEAINSIQLTYFSLLLIYTNTDWPMAMVALLPLKYSTGFNQLIFQPNPYENIFNNAYRKFQYAGISSNFIANNLINCIILFVFFFITTILFSVKTGKQNNLLEIKEGSQLKRLSKQLQKFRIVFRKVYNITFNFSYIMILQVILSIYVEFSFLKIISPLMMIADKLLSMLTLTILFVTVLQNYKHLFLSVKDTYAQNFQIGSREIKYRRVYFVYIFLNAVCIFLLNDKKLFKFTVSFFVLIMAVIYLLFLIIYRPYKHSFLIHGFTVCFNQVMFILSLLMVNLINFNVQMAEAVFLAFDYLLIGFSLAIMFLATVRVIYDWKYGEEHIIKKIKLEIDEEKQQQKRRLMKKAVKKQEKKNTNNKNNQNAYLYKNQKLEAQKIDFLNDLKNRTFLTEWQKDHAYFNVYDRKPIGWVLQNQTQEKYKALLQKEKQRFLNDVEKQKMIKMKNEKLKDINYMDQLQKIKQKLRHQHGIRQAKKEQKKQEKRSKMKAQNSGQ